MEITNSILSYRRFLKRRNFSAHTLTHYLNDLKQFLVWVDVPIEQVEKEKVVTIHSEEASLEDIFIDITGRGLTE